MLWLAGRHLIKCLFTIAMTMALVSCGKISGSIKKLTSTAALTDISFDREVINITEGSAAQIVVVLKSARSSDSVVKLELSNGSADFQPVPAEVTIAKGEVTQVITLTTIDDSIYESGEVFTLTLSSSDTTLKLVKNTTTIAVTDNESAPVINLSTNTQTVTENAGNANVVVQMSGTSSRATVVGVSTTAGTAVSPGDYTSPSSLWTISAGATLATFSVALTDDAIAETAETFTLSLTGVDSSSPSSGTLGATTTQTVTINDDDANFNISGLTGNTDVTADSDLNSTTAPTLNWTAMAGAGFYEVTILADDGTTVVCALESTVTPMTSFSPTACTLNAGTFYKAKLTSKTAGNVSMGDAGNSLYRFFVNRNPSLSNDSYYVNASGTASLDPRSNDSDADSHTLTISAKTNGTNGTVAITGSGTGVSYTPSAGFYGQDSFTYTVQDGHGGTGTATVTVQVVGPHTWTGLSDGNWNTPANWCKAVNGTYSGCTGGTVVGDLPTSTSTVIFDNTCTLLTGTCNAAINANASAAGVRLNTGYTGTLTQNSTRTLSLGSGGYLQNAGTFVGGDSAVTLTNSLFEVSGGSFTSTSAVLKVGYGADAGSDTAQTIFKLGAAATWTHNSGTVEFGVAAQTCAAAYPAMALDAPANTSFHHFTISGSDGGCDAAYLDLKTRTYIVLGNLVHSSANLNNGTLEVRGNYTIGSQTVGTNMPLNTATVKLNGTVAQVINGGSTQGAHLIIDKSSGGVSVGTASLFIRKLTILDGVFTAPTNLKLGYDENAGVDASETILTIPAQINFVTGGGTVTVLAAGLTCPNGEVFEMDLPDGFQFDGLTVSGSDGGCDMATLRPIVGRKVVVNGAFNWNNSQLSGNFDLKGNITANNSNLGGASQFTVNGTGNQTVTVTAGGFGTGTWTVNKASGLLTLGSALTLGGAGQDFTLTSGTVVMAGFNLTITDELTMAAGTSIFTGCGTLTEVGGAVAAGNYVRHASNGTVHGGSMVSLSMNDPSVTEGNAGTANLNFVVTASANQCGTQVTTFSYATSNGTATTADSDYVSATNTATIPNGSSVVTIAVQVSGDTKFEVDETVTLTISSPTNGIISDNSGTGTATNDDTAPTISVANISLTEGDTGGNTTSGTFTVTLAAVSGVDMVVAYAASDGTGTSADDDYTALSGNLTVAAGSTTGTFALLAKQDTKYEPNETVNLTLSGGSGYTSSGSTLTATCTINNDDSAPTLSVANVSANEGSSLAYVVTQSAVSGYATTFNYATSNFTADSASDYTSASGSATIAIGATVSTISVTTADDNFDEADEKVWLTLSTVVNATGPSAPAVGTIKDATLNFNFMRGTLPSGLTFTRGTTATYWGRDGLLKSAAINTPRFEYDPVTLEPKGLLFEDYSFNRLQRSEDLSDGVWTKQRFTLSSDAATAPDGTTTADLLTEDGNAGAHNYLQTVTLTANTVHTMSVFVKPHAVTARRYFQLTIRDTATVSNGFYANFDLQGGVVQSSGVLGSGTVHASGISAVGNGWYRAYVTGVGDASSTSFYYAVQFLNNSLSDGYPGDGSSALYFWGMQIEDEYLMSSYIPTTTAGLSRSSDVMSVNSFSSYYDDAGWTFSMDFQKQFFEPSTFSFARAFGAICKSTSCSSEGYLFDFNSSTTQLRLRKRVAAADAGTSVVAITPSSSTIFQFVVSKGSQGTTTVNGTSGTTSAGSLPTGIDTMYIGGHNTDRGLNGHIRRASFRPRTFTNTQAQAITTETSPACPYGYVPVPKNSSQYNADFCIAQYEMRQVNSSAMSQAASSPWVSIARGATAATASSAWKACADVGVGYNLVSNDQWQTIARDIVSVTSNWSTGVVGNGYLNRGHSDSSPASICNSTVANVTADCSTSAGGGFDDQLRTHTLSNSSTIWDLGGNAGEWVSDDDATAYGSDDFVSQITDVSHATLASDGRTAKSRFGPSQNFTSLNAGTYGGLGIHYFATPGGAIARGHDYSQGGVFSTYHAGASTTQSATIGFRCVFEP